MMHGDDHLWMNVTDVRYVIEHGPMRKGTRASIDVSYHSLPIHYILDDVNFNIYRFSSTVKEILRHETGLHSLHTSAHQ